MENYSKVPNHLKNEKSPYLLQHAYNPVDWFPWGNDAFEKAQNEDKPIFLSIGYSTCHWCHVMERESFEDAEVAALLNEKFVCIKVDKEERPDIDSIYMSVCQTLTGSGGWPLTILMLPDQKPFFAGTYFPKKRKYGRIGLIELLTDIGGKWKSDKKDILKTSQNIMDAVIKSEIESRMDEIVPKEIKNMAISQYRRSFDPVYGGFGFAPKFPSPHNLLLLLRLSYYEQDSRLLPMVEKTLASMYLGGIFDHIGYGFSRYSTDEKWLVPHFEKMLYDNALLSIAYLECSQLTGNELYGRIAEKTLQYVLREMTDPEGGFYCSQDADSEGEEGKYYVFTPHEIEEQLGDTEGKRFCEYYGVTKKGNFEGKNIPNRIGKILEEEPDDICSLQLKLYQYRLGRFPLHKDDKILTSWNSLMITAFAKAYQITGKNCYLETAAKAVSFIEKNLSRNGRLAVRYREGDVGGNGTIDDYAFYIWSLITLYEVSFEVSYLIQAKKYTDNMIDHFFDVEHGGFYLYADDSEALLYRPKELYDGAIPSGNSVALYCLIKLSTYTADQNLQEAAEKQMSYVTGSIGDYPMGHSFSIISMLSLLYESKELVCVADNREEANELIQFLASHFLPDFTVLLLTPENRAQMEKIADFTKDYRRINDKMTMYLCKNQTCSAPFHELEKILNS